MTDIFPFSPTLISVFGFIFGSCIGSFLNVCILRIPEGASIIYPGSRCPACGHAIPFYHNIPLISYLVLRGRCRHCRNPISVRYFLIEALAGLMAVAVLITFGVTVQALYWFIFIAVLIVISFIDIDHGIIPDRLSLPGIVLFSSSALIVPDMTAWSALTGIVAGGGSLYLIALTYYLVRKQDGMGGGDIKLLAMIGAATGLEGVIVTVFIGSVIGTAAGAAIMLRRQSPDLKLKIPFGPFLSAGAVCHLFVGEKLVAWYLNPNSLLL